LYEEEGAERSGWKETGIRIKIRIKIKIRIRIKIESTRRICGACKFCGIVRY